MTNLNNSPAAAPLPTQVVSYSGFGEPLQIKVHGGVFTAAGQIADIKKIYEPFLASRVLPRSGLCLDIGAGSGCFAIAFAKAFTSWKVVCLEADKDQFAALTENVKAQGLTNVICLNATIHPALGGKNGVDAVAALHGKAKTTAALFQRLAALPSKLAAIVNDDGVPPEEIVSLPAMPAALVGELAPDLIRLDAPGCEEAIARAIADKPVPMLVGRVYPFVPSSAFSPSKQAGKREFYLVHGEHALRRDYEDNFAARQSRLDVVVAMYNTRNFIQECVDSVLADGNPDIRVLVVDDGSTDGSGDLVEQLYRTNPRVVLLRKANGGCASARNYGRMKSDATHIAFIDADDRVDPGLFTALLETARYSGTLVAEGEFKTFVTDPDGVDVFTPSYEDRIYKVPGFHRIGAHDYDWIKGEQIAIGQPTIWRRIHRRDFLDRKNIWFPEHVRAFDDQIFQLLVCNYAGSIAHVRGHFYHYRQHSAQDIKQGDERHFYSFNMYRSVLLRALDEGWNDVGAIVKSLLNTMRWSYSGLRADLKSTYAEAAAEFIAVLNRTYPDIVTPEQMQKPGIPGLAYLVQRRLEGMIGVHTNYGVLRLESWLWQPEFIRMMQNINKSTSST